MSNRACFAALVAGLALLPAAPAFAANEIVITHAKVLAGNVTPGDPAGYPARVGASGSYVLGSNLTPPVGQTAIQVFANNVTIDLSGYTISGSGESAWYGIVGAGGRHGATIKNGTIEGFKLDGINASSNDRWVVENMQVVDNGRDGVVVRDYALIKSSVVVGNTARGIYADGSSVIQGNTVSDNGSRGIAASTSAIIGNAVNANGSYGIYAAASTVVGNESYGNESYGLVGGGSTGYSGNTLVFNNAGDDQAVGAYPAHPNHCNGTGCP